MPSRIVTTNPPGSPPRHDQLAYHARDRADQQPPHYPVIHCYLPTCDAGLKVRPSATDWQQRKIGPIRTFRH